MTSRPPSWISARSSALREELELRELDRLVDALEDAVDVDAGLDELGREPERLRRRVRVLKSPRVRDERDVERLRDLRRQIDPELAKDVADDLAGGRRTGNDEVDLGELGVVVVVIDVERELHLVEQRRGLSHALRVRTVERHEHAGGRVLGQLTAQLVQRKECVLGGWVGVAAQVHDRVLAERVEAELHAEDRAERIPVGILVRHEQEAVESRRAAATAVTSLIFGCELIDQL